MIPSEHKATAETMLEAFYKAGTVWPSHADRAIAAAHAQLARAAGTGEHYETADELLATAAGTAVDQARDQLGSQALLHALLADL